MGDLLPKFGELVSDWASKGLDKLSDTNVGSKLIDYAGTKAMEYSRSPQGKLIDKMVSDFKYQQATEYAKLSDSHRTLTKGIEKDPNLRNSINLGKTTLSDIHAQIPQNHPLRTASASLLSEDPLHATRTLPQIENANMAKARLNAITTSFGPHMQNVMPLIVELQDHTDPRMATHANRLLNNLSNDLKDTIKISNPTAGGGKIAVSSTKVEIARGLKKINTLRQARLEGGADVKMLRPEDISLHSTYKSPENIERAVSNWVRLVQVPLVVIPHIGTYFNLGDAPLKAMGRVLLNMSDKEMNSMIYASGALSGTMHDIMHAYLEGRTGMVSKLPFGMAPSVGELLYKSIHTPGFHYLREKQIWMAAALGYHSSLEWGALAAKGDRRAIAELSEMGLDAKAIAQRGGKLTQEELQKGIFHYADNRVFITRLQSQSLHSNENIFMRSATMYHSFLNAQVSFMRREALKMIKTGDIMGIAQFAGTLGILFPAVAPMLKSLEILGRTGSTKQAGDNLKDEYSTLVGAKGKSSAASEYLDLVCHIGGMGVFENYIQAAGAHRLQAATLGPLFSTPLSAVEDAVNSWKTTKKGRHNFKPLIRDTAQDLLPLIGKPLSHILAPTAKEQAKVRLARRGRRR